MNLANTLSQITALSVPERLELVQLILDSIAAEQESKIPEAHRLELERRLAEHQAHPDDVISWDEIKAYVRRPR